MSEKAPPWAYERPEVHPHDPSWATRAAAERDTLTHLLAPWLVDGVEHVGSTAVPGLAAKPVIDLMASVTTLDAATPALLATHGWVHVPPHLDNRPWRRFYVKPDATGQRREAHLHVIQAGHPRWTDQLRFRDALRADKALAQAYADLKRRLSDESGHDREAYTEGKATFVATVLRAPHA
ncbi:GrpB family protein [Lentzea sp. NPDC003310]|uniref:GrpB family protein n=1 Tax=Lentzea sp. NPDC003310 TaxID=3154447 RepID=UPI0033A7E1E0